MYSQAFVINQEDDVHSYDEDPLSVVNGDIEFGKRTDNSTSSKIGTGKRKRTKYTYIQLEILENEFKRNIYLNSRRRSELAKQLSIKEAHLKVWFQNRRMKHKRDLEAGRPHDKSFSKSVSPQSQHNDIVNRLLSYSQNIGCTRVREHTTSAPISVDTKRLKESTSVSEKQLLDSDGGGVAVKEFYNNVHESVPHTPTENELNSIQDTRSIHSDANVNGGTMIFMSGVNSNTQQTSASYGQGLPKCNTRIQSNNNFVIKQNSFIGTEIKYMGLSSNTVPNNNNMIDQHIKPNHQPLGDISQQLTGFQSLSNGTLFSFDDLWFN